VYTVFTLTTLVITSISSEKHKYNILVVPLVFCGRLYVSMFNTVLALQIDKLMVENSCLDHFNIAINIPYFRKIKFVRVSSLVLKYSYNVCVVKRLELCFP